MTDYFLRGVLKIVEAPLVTFLLRLFYVPLRVIEYKQTSVILLNVYFRLC